MCNRTIRLIVFPLVYLIVFLMPFLLLYFLGFIAHRDWNANSAETQCLITNHYVNDDTCSYDCACTTDADGQYSCQTCYYSCYKGTIQVSYLEAYTHNFDVILEEDYADTVRNKLAQYYPINSSLTCYYNKDNPSDVKLKREDHNAFYIASICVIVIGSIAFVVWAIVETVFYFISKSQR